MGEYSTIMARDGHEFQAWLAAAPGRPRGAVVVVQEIFGVNSHIRKVSDGFAADGYTAIAPCLFDRVRRGIELGSTPPAWQGAAATPNSPPPGAPLPAFPPPIPVGRHPGDRGPEAEIGRAHA